jgi:type I restriction enzyme S subunit
MTPVEADDSVDGLKMPEGWALITLSELTQHRSGNSKLIKGKLHATPAPDLFPAFSASGQDVWHTTWEHDGDAIIISAVGARCGKAFKANGKWSAIANTHVVKTIPAVLDCDFAFLLLNDESYWMKGGSAQPFVKVAETFKRSFRLPPLAEQRRIVAKVEELLARVNAARERLAKVPGILKRFRQSILAAACSGQLTAEWRIAEKTFESVDEMLTRFGVVVSPVRDDLELSEIPAEWRWVSLRTVMDRNEAFCYGVVQPGADDPRGVFLVRAGDLEKGTVDLSQLRRVPRTVDESYPRSRLRGGELLVTVVGAGIGESAIAPDECAGFNCARAIAKIPVRQNSATYILRWLQTRTARGWMENDAREVARPTLNLEQLQTLPIPLPSIIEQREIVRRVEALFALADKIEARVRTATARVEKITRAILAKAFRGELVETEAELARRENRPYEPASALLERIRADRQSAALHGAPKRGGRKRSKVTTDPAPVHLSNGRAKKAIRKIGKRLRSK